MLTLKKLKEYAKTNKIALINREEQLSYRELDARSDTFAAWLIKHFGEEGSPVVLCGEKETSLLCCMLGTLKAGRAYVPIDSVVPDDRAVQIIADVQPQVIVDFTGRSLGGDKRVWSGETIKSLLLSSSDPVSEEKWVSGEEAAYILFTSGSTGRPKGVPITVDNLEAFCKGVLPFYPEDGVILNQVSYSFDVSGCAVYAGLSRGMSLFTIDHKMTADFGELFTQLRASGLTTWVSTPSFAELCIQSRAFCAEMLPQMRQFLFCGEVLTHALCDELVQRFPQAQILNTYGPTEATVLVTAVNITEEMRCDNRPIPIGAPINGVTLRLTDVQGREIITEEETGELSILGPSVGPGYFGRPDLTQKSFFTETTTGLRGYRTGDLCYRKNDLYYYCGRVDNQLKLGGYRIEIEDIENNLQKLGNVQRAAVVPIWKEEKVQYLAAFLLLKEPDGLTNLKRTIQMKKEAAAFLPSYMIPRQMFVVESFPLNVNGKIDKKVLTARLMEGKS